jgi:hypothetical protein
MQVTRWFLRSVPRFGEDNMLPSLLRRLSLFGPLVGPALVCLPLALHAGTHGVGQNGGDFSQNPGANKVPAGVILVKGAWSSASDAVTPLPEGGTAANNAYSNPYFGLTYPLSTDWTQQYEGPPPSDSGYYVLAQIQPAQTSNAVIPATILITAQDMFFAPTPAGSALELINYTRDNLRADYKVERPPAAVQIAKHSFVRLGYVSPAAGLHWYVLATQIRCHMVQFIFTSRDIRLIESLAQAMNNLKLPAQSDLAAGTGRDEVPVCIKDYASGDNIIERVDPVLTERRFNAIPVRVIIDVNGKVKHIHFISAFPEQAKGITDSLLQWRFKPHLRDGQPVEVETGIMFGRAQLSGGHAGS